MAMLIEIYFQFISSLPTAITEANNGKDDNPDMEVLIKETKKVLEQYDKPIIESLSSGFNAICRPMIRNLFTV